MPTPFFHQIEGALFLANRRAALLADDPRVGKTGAAIMACDYILAKKVLVVTTASGRDNFGREFREWQRFGRTVQVVHRPVDPVPLDADVVVTSWSILADGEHLRRLTTARRWDVLILDESHYAKNPTAKRTRAAYDILRPLANVVWCLTGTPMPNAPNDLWPMLKALASARIENMSYDAFVRRYCVTRPKVVGGHRIDIVVGGKNVDELRGRLDGFWLRRTQQDVGIREPIYSLFSLAPGDRRWHEDMPVEAEAIVEAAENGDTKFLDMHLGPLRRITGSIKARSVAAAVAEELQEGGLDKIVLMAWHREVIESLTQSLSPFGVVGIDGSTPSHVRQKAVDAFQHGPARVFVGQIQAAGEAIDLSASCNLMFVEGSFVPKDMKQAALRITNHNQKRQCLVRFSALTGSIDEAIMSILKRKVSTIREVLADAS